VPFLHTIQRALLSATNTTGIITNSDLELAAVICGSPWRLNMPFHTYPILQTFLQTEFSIIQQTTATGITTKWQQTGNTMWDIWEPSVPPSLVTPFLNISPIPYPPFNCSHTDTALAPWLPAMLKSTLKRWRMPYMPLARCSPHWASLTPDCNHLGNLTSICQGN
jgi:hypothetical protein